MKNYYDQLHELEIAKLRLKTLTDTKDLYFNRTQPGGVSYDQERVMGGIPINKFDTYVMNVEEINNNIAMTKAQIEILEKNLKAMQEDLRKMKTPLAKIYVARYFDGLSINEIAKKYNYSRSQIYRKLQKIRNVTKNATKCDK